MPRFWDRLIGREVREAGGGAYTDRVVEAILRKAEATIGAPARTAGVEIAAGLISRAFASAEVEGLTISPRMMANIGRDLIVRGEAVLAMYRGAIHRASTWDVSRDPSSPPHEWEYWVDIPVPGGNHVRIATGGRNIAHPRYSEDRERPWCGLPPWVEAATNSDLADRIERTLLAEAKAKVGYVLPVPSDGGAASVDRLKGDLAQINGDLALVETTSAGWGEGRTGAPRGDWEARRLGSQVPPALVELYKESQRSMIAACGVPVELAFRADGTATREAWRRCLHGTLMPLGRIVAYELGKLASGEVNISFDRLMASDLSGRARAFQSMVGGGMDIGKAASLAGLMEAD